MRAAWNRLPQTWRFGFQSYVVTILLVTALHPLLPVDFFLPLFTGFAFGRIRKSPPRQAAMVGLIMSACHTVVLGVVGLAVAGLSLAGVLSFRGSDVPGLLLLGIFLVVHLGLFAGAGSVVGGWTVRRDAAAPSPSPARGEG